MHRKCRPTLQKILGGCLLACWVLSPSAQAQLRIGDNLSMNMNGNLGTGYSGEFGNGGLSGHGLFGTANAALSGSYFNPNFLSFNVRPFYNRNQDNSSFASVLSETGVDLSTNIFSGSHFPGSVSFSKSFTDGSQYGIVGTTGLTSNSDTRNFAISWSELVPKLPSLTATFSDNASSSTIQGENGGTDTGTRIFSLISQYKIDGFGLLGYMTHQTVNVNLPAFLAGTNSHTDSANTSYGFSVNHALPLSGIFQTTYSRTDYNSKAGAYDNNGWTDTADSTVTLQPVSKLTVTGQVRYTRNLIGALQQSLAAGGTFISTTNEEASHGLSLSNTDSYNLGHGFIVIGYANRQTQTFAGTTYNFSQYGGTLTYNYSRPLFGILYFSFGMVNNGTNQNGNNIGFVGNLGLKKRFENWENDADFSYSQNAQTVVSYYTTSNYNYGDTIRRRFGANSQWTASYRGLQSGLAQLHGYGNRSDTFLSVLNLGWYGFSGSYSKSHGTAVLSSTGVLTPTPVTPLVSTDQVVYSGKAYGAGVHVSPIRRLIINVNWYRVRSDTDRVGVLSNNNSERYYGQMEYRVRKLLFRAGYWRVNQTIQVGSFRPSIDNSYYFNISRWFNLF